MAKSGFSVPTTAAVALVAATAKTVVGVMANDANFGLDLVGYEISFDGVTASAVPVLVELIQVTFAVNPPGTNSTTSTPIQIYGRLASTGILGGYNWTTEPTTVTNTSERFDLTPNGGTVIRDYPFGQSLDCPLNTGWAIRCTAPAGVNCVATLKVERT